MWTFELSTQLLLLRAVTVLVCSVALCALVQSFALVVPLPVPALGVRARARMRARRHVLFAQLEPVLRRVGALLQHAPGVGLRRSFGRWAFLAGEPAGLCPEEWLALSVMIAALTYLLVHALVSSAQLHWAYTFYATIASCLVPVVRLRALGAERAHELERGLPLAMDLCVLCMGAGCDFSAALAFVVGDAGGVNSVCRDELSRVLDELQLGRTRAEALEAMATRTTSAAVHELVAAVCQAELKGSPLQGTLSIQATGLRQRRSVRAEELAARAGVKMLLPMLLLVGSLLLIIFGPFLVQGAGL